MSATATRPRSGAKANDGGNGDTPEAQYKQFIESRISELEGAQEELARLKSIKSAMDGRPQGNSAGSQPRTTRRRGRLQEFVKLVNERPGITIAQAAKEMHCVNSYLYRVTAKGLQQGVIRKDGSNFFPVEGEPAAA